MCDDINKEIAKELVSQTAGEAYRDIAHPTAQSTGQLISFIPRTIKVWLGRWEKWILNGEYAMKETEALLAEKLKNISEEKIVEPEPYVAIPAIQQLSYSFDSHELRDMYANLLASSMNIDTKYDVHPAFVDIIKQLTPDEAKLLKSLPPTTMNYHPLVDLRLFTGNDTKGHITVVRNYSNIGEGICEMPENICTYIDNLDRLKIICVLEDIRVTDSSKYVAIEKSESLTYIRENLKIEEKHTFSLNKKSFALTEFGESFIKHCIS